MSYFGDGTPTQELLDDAKLVKQAFDFTDSEMVVVLLAVVDYFSTDSAEQRDQILNKQEVKK